MSGTGAGFLLIFLLTVFCSKPAAAETVTVPAQVLTIEAEAYKGCTSITSVSLPEGLLEIGTDAFSGTSLSEVTVPASVTTIGDGAFPSGCRIICYAGSPAAAWAQGSGYDVTIIMDSVFHALFIGQTYENTVVTPVLKGPLTDLRAMGSMLSSMTGTPYRITSLSNLTASGITSAVSSAFAEAREQDVCLLYYSGHGNESSIPSRRGALVGTDSQLVTMPSLRSLLDGIPGDKIIILDSCYSGSILDVPSSGKSAWTVSLNAPALSDGGDAREETASVDLDAVNESIISVFSARKRASSASGDYYIITAASSTESSWELYNAASDQYYGAFTYGLTYGSGYNVLTGAHLTTLPADSSQDQAISLQEAYIFAYSMAASLGSDQHAQVYPSGSTYTLWAK